MTTSEGTEWTWESESDMREHYLELFPLVDFEDEVVDPSGGELLHTNPDKFPF